MSDIRNFGPVSSVMPVTGKPDPVKQTVFFITDRSQPVAGQDYIFGEHWRGTPSCGEVVMTVPADTGPDDAPAIKPDTLEPLVCNAQQDVLLERIVKSAGTGCDNRVLLFIHGYNNIFRSALLRAGQVAHDLDWHCPVLLFSWTSAGQIDRYAADIERSAYAVPLLTHVLEQLNGRKLGVQVLAHSMGNRLLLGTLAPMCALHKERLVQQVILSAPDVGAESGLAGTVVTHDSDDFLTLITMAAPCLDRVTVYASDNDVALMTSETIHGGIPRAGRLPTADQYYPTSLSHLDVVDASLAPGGDVGHGYFALSWEALTDMKQVLAGAAPSERKTLVPCAAGDKPPCPAKPYTLAVAKDRQPSLRFRLYRQLWPH